MNVDTQQWQWPITALCPSPGYFYLIDYGGRVVVKSMPRHVAGRYNILMDRSYMLVLGKSFGVVYFFLSESNCTVGECLIPFSCIASRDGKFLSYSSTHWLAEDGGGTRGAPLLVLNVCKKLKGVTCCSCSVKRLYIFAQ